MKPGIVSHNGVQMLSMKYTEVSLQIHFSEGHSLNIVSLTELNWDTHLQLNFIY